MHQHPRPSPMMASPASSPRTNPNRTNNQRETSSRGSSSHSRTNSDMPAYMEADDGSGDSGVMPTSGPSRDAVKKLDQIIQNFHTKAAILVLQSRMSLPIVVARDGGKKVNKWFQIETDDTNAFREELGLWRMCGGYQNRPPPMIVETYLDTSELTSSQSLVIVDDQGKRWDVLEALNNASGSSDGGMRPRKRNREVILERWRIELRDAPAERIHDFGSTLPTIYKKCIVFFRSLFSTSKIVPTWRFVKSVSKIGSSNSSLRVKCRIMTGDVQPSRYDALTHPLYESPSPVTTDCFLGTTETPVGQIYAEVSYRNDCNFRVDDSEALLSSRFMGADEHYFQPSIGAEGEGRHRASRTAEVGSLPAHKHRPDDSEPIQAYGSLSTFHGDVPPRGSSPISALRAAKTLGSEPNSPPREPAPQSRPMQSSRASLRSLEGISMARRPSVSFQPFKAGSLSSSPAPGTHLQQHIGDMLPPPSPQSLPRGGISALTQARNRSSLTAGMPATLRGGPILTDNIVASSASSSPKPAPISRYSSSFTHRRGRSSYGGTSKILDDDQVSSGKQSLSSSVQPGSGIIAEAAGASSDSLQTDDDNISEFLKLLDSKKTLRSFEPSGETSTKRTSAQLSKFQLMRESHNALTESMSSSTMLHRSSSSSSRQLSSVPPMVAATSMSVSSSPGKPVSPHTPHTPAIPSRLSANSIAEYSEPRRLSYRSRGAVEAPIEDVADDDDDDGVNELGTNAIDIPTSPRPYYPHARRSSSVAQQHRTLIVEDDLGDLPFGIHRSISLGADDREPPSLSSLLNIGQAAETVASPSSTSPSRLLQPAAHISEASAPMSCQASSSLEAHEIVGPQIPRGQTAGSLNSPYRPKFGRTVGRGMTPPHGGSSSSLIDRGSGSERASVRHNFRGGGAYEPDDEPLLFQMSEIGRDNSRRSIEEARGGNNVGSNDRGGFGGLRGPDSSSSSRGASRRGW